jgi:hypothetical protein
VEQPPAEQPQFSTEPPPPQAGGAQVVPTDILASGLPVFSLKEGVTEAILPDQDLVFGDKFYVIKEGSTEQTNTKAFPYNPDLVYTFKITEKEIPTDGELITNGYALLAPTGSIKIGDLIYPRGSDVAKIKAGKSLVTTGSQAGGYTPTAKNRATLRKLRRGESIGFTATASLKAKGLIPRTSRKNKGKKIVSPKYQG